MNLQTTNDRRMLAARAAALQHQMADLPPPRDAKRFLTIDQRPVDEDHNLAPFIQLDAYRTAVAEAA